MKLKAVVDDLESVDEKFRELYTKFTDKDGNERFKLDVEGIPQHPETLALQSAHERVKERNRQLTSENTELKQKADQLPEDFDPDLYERAVNGDLGGGGDVEERIRTAVDAAKKRQEEAHTRDKQKLEGERDKFRNIAENQVKRAAIDAALDEAKVAAEYRKGARAIVAEGVIVSEIDGELVALYKDPEVGDTIPVAEHVKAWAQTDEGKAYVSARGSAGGGAKGDGGEIPETSKNNPWAKDS